MIANNRQLQLELCVVCTIAQQHLYEIANCGHRFCHDCCEGFISSQADNFSQAKCLQQGCGAQLDASKPIYSMLDALILEKLQKYKRFRELQNNPDVKACKKIDCSGFFTMKTIALRCGTCNTTHCDKCFEIMHDGEECNLSKKQDEEMGNLHYKKCPKCRIWVEKVAGCEYISCKCGVQFCYRCGNLFQLDPCRLQALWISESKIRKLMKKIVFSPVTNFSCNTINYSAFAMTALRCLIIITIIFPFTIIYCTVPLFVSIGVIVSLVFLFLPIILFYGVSNQQSIKQKWIFYIILIITYPLIGALLGIAALIIILLFPFVRKCAHHGIYDPFEEVMGKMMICYLKIVALLLLCECKK